MRRPILKLTGAAFLGLIIFGLSHHHGSANVDPREGELEAFVEAAAAVEGVIAGWQQRLARAEMDQADALREQANAEIRASIEAVEGISFIEYQEMRKAIALDPELLARVTELMRRYPAR